MNCTYAENKPIDSAICSLLIFFVPSEVPSGLRPVSGGERCREKWLELERAMHGKRLGGALGEVRKFSLEPARTRGNTRDRPRKNPDLDELGFLYW